MVFANGLFSRGCGLVSCLSLGTFTYVFIEFLSCDRSVFRGVAMLCLVIGPEMEKQEPDTAIDQAHTIDQAHEFIQASRQKALAELKAQKAKAAGAGDRPQPKKS